MGLEGTMTVKEADRAALIAAVTMRKGFDGAASVLLKGRKLAFRVLAEGEAAVPVEDGKGVGSRVDAAKAEQAARPDWKPAPRFPRSFHCRFAMEGGSRPWKDGGKRYSARLGEATSLPPAGSRAFGKGDISTLR